MVMIMIMIIIIADRVLQNAKLFFSEEGGRRTQVKMWSRGKVKKVQTEEATPGKCTKNTGTEIRLE